MKSIMLQLVVVFLSCISISIAVRPDSFQDYIMRHRLRVEQTRQQEEERLLNGRNPSEHEDSGSGSEDPTGGPVVSAIGDSMQDLTTPRTAPQRGHSTCCELGAKAGRKGYLCNPENYRAQIFTRNENRPNNFRLTRIDHDRYIEVRQYSKCVSGTVPRLADDFQRCCKQAYLETLDVDTHASDMPIVLELPLQLDIANKQRKIPTNHKTHMKV